MYPADPDLEGRDEIPVLGDTLKDSRLKCKRLHRFEIRSGYDIKVVCNLKPKFDHISPVEYLDLP